MGDVHDLEFCLLGGLTCVVRSGERVVFANRKVAHLAAVLASHPGKPWQRSALATIIWPESYQDAGLASLRQALALLKKNLQSAGLDPEVVLATSKLEIGFSDKAVGSDVGRFDQLAKTSKQDNSVAILTAALDLCAGLFVPEWESEWAELERTRISVESDRLLAVAIPRLEPSSAAELAQQCATNDPRSETKIQLAMQCLINARKPAEAVKIYRRFERTLREGLGLSPSPATVELAREARRSAAPPSVLPASNLPQNLSEFFGREAEVREIDDLLASGRRVVTIVGPGGIGKTRLALQVATNQAVVHPGVWFVEIASVSHSAQVYGHILDILKAEPDAPRTSETIAEIIKGHDVVIVLDNLEQLDPGIGAVVTDLCDKCPRLRIIATSRERTGATNESVIELAPLPVPEEEDPGIDFASVKLFIDRATQDGAKLGSSDAQAISEIVRRLEGSPLAICLAAVQTATMTPIQILIELDDRFKLLESKKDTFVERHQRLWTCIDWSYATYPEAHAFLKIVALFRGGWTLTTSKLANGGTSVNSLTQTLLRSSLVHEVARNTQVRFDMFEAIREFIRESSTDAEAAAAAAAHAKAMREWILSDEVRFQAFDAGYIPTRAAEIENLRIAFEWALENEPSWTLDIANGLAYYWWSRDLFSEGIQWLTRAIAANPKEQSLPFAMAHRGLATMNTGLNEYKAAYDVLLEGLKYLPADADPVQRARIYNTLGNASANFEPSLAIKHFQDGIELVKDLDDKAMLASLTGNMAFAILMSGQLDEAEAFMARVVEESRLTDNTDWRAQFLHNYGLLAKTRGHWQEAEARFAESRELVEGSTVNPATRGWLTDVGVVVLRQGRLDEALHHFKASAAGVRKAKGSEAFVDLMESMAEWCWEFGDVQEAVALLVASSKIGTAGQRSIADKSLTGFERLSQLKAKLPADVFKNASQRYRGMGPREILEEVEDYEPPVKVKKSSTLR